MIPLVAPTYSQDDEVLYGAIWDDEPEVRAFEEEFAAFVGCRGAVAVNSGTNALVTVLAALEAASVSIPSFGCRALLDAVREREAQLMLTDNRCDIRGAEFHGTDFGGDVGVLPLMFGTRPGGMRIENGTTLVWDWTLALGAQTAFDDTIAVCSFHRDKMISTGRGGMIVAQDEGFLERCRELAYYDKPSNGKYRPAFSFGMTGMQAALGRSQLAQLPSFIERRRHVAAQYTSAFTRAGIECPDLDVDSVFFRYIIGVDDPADKVAKLAGRGIEAGRGVNPPLHRLLDLDPAAFPGAEECWGKLLSVPVHPGLTDDQVEFITKQVMEVCAP